MAVELGRSSSIGVPAPLHVRLLSSASHIPKMCPTSEFPTMFSDWRGPGLSILLGSSFSCSAAPGSS